MLVHDKDAETLKKTVEQHARNEEQLRTAGPRSTVTDAAERYMDSREALETIRGEIEQRSDE